MEETRASLKTPGDHGRRDLPADVILQDRLVGSPCTKSEDGREKAGQNHHFAEGSPSQGSILACFVSFLRWRS
jgi:hypothetical protein